MNLARQEAQRFNHEYLGTEHILLGLVQEQPFSVVVLGQPSLVHFTAAAPRGRHSWKTQASAKARTIWKCASDRSMTVQL